jgi:hypothetical protein
LHVGLLAALVFGVLWSPLAVRADILEMYDGRRIEGQIFEETSTTVRIDTVVSGVRVKLGLPRRQIRSLQKVPLPEGFFDLEPPTEDRVSNPATLDPDADLYLEIPVVGRFGAQVTPEGIRKALSYAARYKIPHVVFYVDSQGGDRLAARRIYETLAKYPDTRFYALVRDSVGVAMAVTVFCEKIFMLPGSNLGGVVLHADDEGVSEDARALELAQVAYEVGQNAAKRGWPAPLIRAMIDPVETVFAWRDEGGQLVTAPRLPETVSRDAVIVSNGPDSVLTLNRTQAVDLGARSYNGTVEGMGAELGLTNWTRESDYGATAMMSSAKSQQRRTAVASKKKELEISRVIQRRDATKKYIDRCLTLAHAWDPEQSAYSSFEKYEQKWERYWGGPLEPTITRTRWRELTDVTIDALSKAYQGVERMKDLEDKAVDLGLEPLYPEGELEKYQDDIEVKVTLLRFWRERKTSAS